MDAEGTSGTYLVESGKGTAGFPNHIPGSGGSEVYLKFKNLNAEV